MQVLIQLKFWNLKFYLQLLAVAFSTISINFQFLWYFSCSSHHFLALLYEKWIPSNLVVTVFLVYKFYTTECYSDYLYDNNTSYFPLRFIWLYSRKNLEMFKKLFNLCNVNCVCGVQELIIKYCLALNVFTFFNKNKNCF